MSTPTPVMSDFEVLLRKHYVHGMFVLSRSIKKCPLVPIETLIESLL